MKRARHIFLVVWVLGALNAFGADRATFDKENYPPGVGDVTRSRREEKAKKNQPARYDVKVAIPDIDTAEKEIEGLNNTVSNAMYLAEQTKQREEASQGVFQSVVIAAVLLGAGIFLVRKFGSRLGFLFNVSDEPVDAASYSQAEEKSFSDFVAAFKVGPRPARRNAADTASDSLQAEPLKLGESVLPGPLQTFFENAPKAIVVMRSLIQEITRATDQLSRQKLLATLCQKNRDLKCMAGLPEVLPVWQLASALEGLTRQLSDKDRNVTPSTLRTVASAVDLLEALSVPGIRSDLLSNPPIRLLAVDDDSLSRHAVSFALKKALNKPDLAENGEAALALVSNLRYDAIFLDVQMPGMNGFETCSKIHGTELNRTTPVVFVTCQSDFDSRAKSTLSGGIDLIGKPFLTFEITVKALTLALRSRLKPSTALHSPALELPLTKEAGSAEGRPEAIAWPEPKATVTADSIISLLIEKELVNEKGDVRSQSSSSSPSSSSVRKSREERRRDRRKRAQSMRGKKKDRKQRERPKNASSKNQSAADSDEFNLPTDILANAFLAHAPANIGRLQDRVEEIYQAFDDEACQEIVVELYLAVHSLAAEASLAKLQTIFQLSSAMEALLKKLLEDPKQSVISSLSVVAHSFELLHDFCDARLTANLSEAPYRILVVANDPAARQNLQTALQLPSAKIESAETDSALKLMAEKQFDAIFFDVHQPGTGLFSLCSKLRQHKTPILFVTGEQDSENILELLQCGSECLLRRTSSPVEISLTALTSALGNRFEHLMGANAQSDQLEGGTATADLVSAED